MRLHPEREWQRLTARLWPARNELLDVIGKATRFTRLPNHNGHLSLKTCRNFGLVRSATRGSFPVTPDDLGNLSPVLRPADLPGVPHHALQPRPLLLEQRMVLVRKLQDGGIGRLGEPADY